jgi:hypothetical protein
VGAGEAGAAKLRFKISDGRFEKSEVRLQIEVEKMPGIGVFNQNLKSYIRLLTSEI